MPAKRSRDSLARPLNPADGDDPSWNPACISPAALELGGAALDGAIEAARLRHVRDLERPRDQRPVAEQPADQALLDFDRADALQTYRRGPAAKRAAHERELVVRHHHVGSL